MGKLDNMNLGNKKYLLEGLENIPGGFLVYRADFSNEEILYANKALIELFECKDFDEFLEFTHKSFKGVVHPDDYNIVEDAILKQIENNYYDQVHYRIVTKNGNVKHIEDYGKYYVSEEYGPLFYVFISSEKTRIDSLTGLPKMKYFISLAKDGIDELFSKGKTPVMVSFDLIGLKNYNFKHGIDDGDVLLTNVAKIIRKNFGTMCSSRFGEDNFYAFSSKDDIDLKVKNVIEELRLIPDGKTAPIRIGLAECDKENNIESLCNKSRIAVESLKNVKHSAYKWFNEEESYALSLKEYIINHIDEAISKGWIEPYYQPVVRTLTKRLCSLEVLARWIDPVHGMIACSNFVSILEEIGLAYKLDMYIAERAISTLQLRLKQGLPVVPVSINVSRMDFEYINPVEVIAATCDMHDVRRSLVCIEITESAFISNKEVIKKAINDFHQAGFEVWMDDFGSGYSSLNVLKDFDFDELKLDMAFIHDFGEKSRNIITMAVRMAKSLGMHTLAEGVETEEHFQFLKSIGCEKIQGYYFGEPKPLQEQLENLRLKGIVYENRETSELYQKTGKVDLVSDRALALFFFDGKRYTTIFRNQAYIDLFPNLKDNTEQDLNANMNGDLNPLATKFRSFGNKVLSSGKIEYMTFAAQSSYYHFSLDPITITSKGAMMIARLDATTFDEQREFEERDGIIRSLSTIYDCVYLFDFDEDTRTVIQSNFKEDIEGEVLRGVHKYYYKAQFNKIYEFDLARWQKFADPDNLITKARESGKGFFSDVFLVKNDEGNYIWTEFIVICVSKDNRQVIICVKPAALEDLDKIDYVKRILKFTNASLTDEVKSEGDIWKSLMENGNIKFFWKDKNRRFLGASKAFRKYYGFTNDNQFIGKTDEEVGWHLNDTEFESDEVRVLTKGEIINFATTVNVVDGVAHRIIASKVPVYHDAKIIGLVGYFMDSEEDGLANEHYDRRLVDPTTGLMNTYGLMVSLFDLEDNYKANREEYTFVVIRIKGYEEFFEDHGNELSNELLKEISKLLKSSFDDRAVIARTEGANFSICSRGVNGEEMYRYLKTFEEKLSNLKEIKKERTRLTIAFGTASANEGETVQKVAQKAFKRLEVLDQNEYEEKEINPDSYNDVPLPFVIVRPIYDSIGKVKDMEYVFINKAYSELTGKKPKELIGKGYLDTFKNTGKEWIDYAFRATQGEYVRASLYDGASHHWLRFTASPCEIPAACSLVLDVVDQERRIEQSSERAMATSDEVIKIVKLLESQERNSKANQAVVEELGKVLDATSVFIFTTDLITFTCIAEWCKEGIEPRKNLIVKKPYSILKDLEKYFIKDSKVIYKTINDLDKEDVTGYNYCKDFNVESVYATPIIINNRTVGYVVVENANPESKFDTKEVIEQTSLFIAARFNLRKLYQTQVEYEKKNAIAYKTSLTDDLSLEIAKLLGNKEDYQVAIDMALDKLGAIFHPTRTFVLEISDKSLDNIIEWCNSGVLSIKKLWTNILKEDLINIFGEELLNDSLIKVDNIDVYKELNPQKYQFLKENNIYKFIEAPIYVYDKLRGFIIMTNYNESQIIDLNKMLESLAFFVGFRIMAHQELLKYNSNKMLEELKSSKGEKVANSLNTPIPSAIIKVILNDTEEYAIDFKYENVNEGYSKLVDRTKEELIGHNYYEIFHSPDPQLVSDSYRAAILGITTREKRMSIESGKFVETIIAPYSKAGYAMFVLLDIDLEYREDLERKNKVSINESVIDVVKVLNGTVIFEDAINKALRTISDHIRAEHIYILEYEGDYFRESFYYSLDGVEDNMSNKITIDKELLYRSSTYKVKDNDYFYDEVSRIEKTNPDVAKVLKDKDVVNILHTPLYNGDVVIGYLGIQNFDKNYLDKYSKILIELSYFFSSKMVFHKHQMQMIYENESMEEENKKALNAISYAYYGLIILDVESNMMKPIGMPEEIEPKIGKGVQPFEPAKVIYLERYVSLEDKKKVEDFVNLSTLDERMKYKKVLSLDYHDLNGDKRRIIISVLNKNDKNKITKLIIAVED